MSIFYSFQNVSAKYPNMMKNIMQGQQNRMMAPHMMGPSPKRPKLMGPLPGAPVSLGGPRSASPGMNMGGPRGPMMGNRPMNPMGPGGPGGMMGPNGGPLGRGPFPDDMNMGPMGPSGPMRPMGGGPPGPDGDLGGASPGNLPTSSSCNSPQTSVPVPSPSMTTTAPITTNSSGDPSIGFNDASTPDPSRLDGSQSPSLQDPPLSGK